MNRFTNERPTKKPLIKNQRLTVRLGLLAAYQVR
jgi:hypothetical protein